MNENLSSEEIKDLYLQSITNQYSQVESIQNRILRILTDAFGYTDKLKKERDAAKKKAYRSLFLNRAHKRVIEEFMRSEQYETNLEKIMSEVD